MLQTRLSLRKKPNVASNATKNVKSFWQPEIRAYETVSVAIAETFTRHHIFSSSFSCAEPVNLLTLLIPSYTGPFDHLLQGYYDLLTLLF